MQTMLSKNARLFTLLFLIFSSVPNIFGQGFLRADGQRIVNEKGENILLKGIGLGGWMLQEGYMLRIYKDGQQNKIRSRMEELIGKENTGRFYQAWLNNHTTRADIDALKAWGFNSVRLPMHYSLYTLPIEKEPVKGKDTWLKEGFRLTDSLLAWCKANQMYLILDLHAAPGGQGNDLNISDGDLSKPMLWNSGENQRKMVALWRKLAQRYANEPWIGAYDIINEPNYGFEDPINDKNGLKEKKNEPLRKLMVDITKAIREVDKKHLIIIEGNGWGNNYNNILPVWDNNMALSFHKYWNHNRQADIQHILDTREKHNVPVWLGETGENSNVWFTEAIHLLETHNIGWAWWPLKKLGTNNPLEIRSNPEYDQVVRYWNGEGERPGKESATKGLLALANDLKLQHNIFHADVVDAMIRQPFSTQTLPFQKNELVNGLTINASDYDLGRNGFAYYDVDTADYHISDGGARGGNKGRTYRNDGADISRDPDTNQVYISHTEPGEWWQYTLQVPQNRKYTIKLEVAAEKDGGRLALLNGSGKLGSIAIPATGGLHKWETVSLSGIEIPEGEQPLRILAESGGFNLKSLRFQLD